MGRSILEQAEARGEAKAKREAAALVLTVRFGALPAEVEAALAAAGPERLDKWLDRAATAATLAEVGINGGKPSS